MTATITKIALPSLSEDEAQASKALGHSFAPIPLSVGTARMLARIESGGPAAQNDPWVLFTLDGADAALQLPMPMIARLIGLPVENGLGTDVALLLEDALADWLDAAETTGLPTVRLNSVAMFMPALPLRRTLGLRGASTAGEFVQHNAQLGLSYAAATRLAGHLAGQIEPRELSDDLPVIGAIRLQGPKITSQQLSGLKIGDGISLPPAISEDVAPSFQLHLGQKTALLTPHAGGYRMVTGLFAQSQGQRFMDQQDKTPATPLTPATADDAPANPAADLATGPEQDHAETDDLPMQLSFRVDEATLSLGALGTLGPGALIPVSGKADTTLDILANGQKIGEGELVAIGDDRAIRVLKLG